MRAEHEAVMAKRASGEHTSRAEHQALLAEQAERLRGECEAAMAEQAERLRPEHEAALEALRAEHAAALTAKSAAMRNLWGQQARPRSEPCGRRRDDTSLLASVPQVESLRAKDEARASARHWYLVSRAYPALPLTLLRHPPPQELKAEVARLRQKHAEELIQARAATK